MSSVIISGDTSGAITLSAPAVSGTNTATLPAATGTVMVSGNMPAFSAYANSAQTITTATITKIQFNVEEFDTANCFDSTTNYRFTPNVAGYYQINCQLAIGSTITLTREIVYLYKNSSTFKYGTDIQGNGIQQDGVLSTLVYANGTTDYFEIYTYTTGAGTIAIAGGTNNQNYFQASMVRSA